MGGYFFRSFTTLVYLTTLFPPPLEAAKTVKLDLFEERDLSLHRRQSTGDGTRDINLIWNSTTFRYYAYVTIGDSNQNLKLAIIQNPFTWVPRPWNRSVDCDDYYNDCEASSLSGYFNVNPPDSSTYRNLSASTPFSIEYDDGGDVTGIWGQDDFRMGDITVPKVNFGVIEQYGTRKPCIGLDKSDSSVDYPSFLEVMQSQNLINTPTFGVYLGDLRGKDDTGKSITFGGIDTLKFKLPLKTVSSKNGYTLDLIGVNLIGDNGLNTTEIATGGSPQSVTISFSTPSIFLPTDIFNDIMNFLGASESNDYDIRKLPAENTGIEFVFRDDLRIFVPFSQMILPDTYNPGWYTTLIQEDTDGGFYLGSPFFRAAYVFYDYANSEISIAPSILNVTNSNITEIGVNNASVTTLQWLYVTDEPNTLPTSTTTSSPTPEPTSNPKKSIIGPVVGGVVGGIAVIAAAIGIFFYLNRRKKPDTSASMGMNNGHMPNNGQPGPMGGEMNNEMTYAQDHYTAQKPNPWAHNTVVSPVTPGPGPISPGPGPLSPAPSELGGNMYHPPAPAPAPNTAYGHNIHSTVVELA
ncbi:hypothetical protein TWF694_009080 [Orbilia ellipsospora]|uniref:Peptidase A1 domain-containing protein n=1 Tax=Orbilia ellipsospora TaxID=2528407 RepID=A0AAV9XF82_9PEZI